MRRGRQIGATLALAGIVALAPAGPALAHASLIGSTPADGASVSAPRSISLQFDDVVKLVPQSLVLTSATGSPLQLGAPRIVGNDRTLTATVPERLAQGRYFVAWRILADDGHIVVGTLTFNVLAGAGAATPASASTPAAPIPTPGQPAWPIVVAALLAVAAGLGAAVVVRRGLRAVQAVDLEPGPDPYPAERMPTPARTQATRH